MIFKFMKEYSNEFPIKKMAHMFNVSRSGYYKYINKKESKTLIKNKDLKDKIINIYNSSKGLYGSPRIHAKLKQNGEFCSRKRVHRIMKNNDIKAKAKKKWKATYKGSKDLSKIAPNEVNQNFDINEINKVWVLDITYISTSEGWLYLSAILDLFSRKIVGLSMGNTLHTDLVIRSLNQAIKHRCPSPGLILHSDRGVQYTSKDYKAIVEKNHFTLSMSGKGNCYDNAAMESFFHTLKTEHVFFNKYKTRKEAMQSIFEYVEVFYNRQRLHSYLGYLSPMEYEKRRG